MSYPIPVDPVLGAALEPVAKMIFLLVNIPLLVLILKIWFSFLIEITSVLVKISTWLICASLIRAVWILTAWLDVG